ncbi:hypothetical protein TSAR_013322 [Trichomalopsis sarcophagae]|uniref:Uncharacterized protein n=1 Tax=Trichomalopsis sarcophagae TaxID=543379 RepID=A0A232EMZ9_9HYME|nr:hypothetical protein TSAR_013322 [Trichomalopsis sarcophagae]
MYHRYDERDAFENRINELIRRVENGTDFIELFNASNLEVYIDRIYNVRRAQELRWLYTQAEYENSPLYTAPDIVDLLDRVHESFNGQPEQ